MKYDYKTKSGVCTRTITVEIENGIVKDVSFVGGCHGNTQGVAALVRGMTVEEVIARLKNIKCGYKESSCPDQLAIAIQEAVQQQKISSGKD